MLRAMLADRFKLVVHNGTKPFAEYALIPGKRLRLKEAVVKGESGCQSLPQNTQ